MKWGKARLYAYMGQSAFIPSLSTLQHPPCCCRRPPQVCNAVQPLTAVPTLSNYYYVVNSLTGKCLYTPDGTALLVRTCQGTVSEQWHISSTSVSLWTESFFLRGKREFERSRERGNDMTGHFAHPAMASIRLMC